MPPVPSVGRGTGGPRVVASDAGEAATALSGGRLAASGVLEAELADQGEVHLQDGVRARPQVTVLVAVRRAAAALGAARAVHADGGRLKQLVQGLFGFGLAQAVLLARGEPFVLGEVPLADVLMLFVTAV